METYRALVLEEDNGVVRSDIAQLPVDRLPVGDVVVRVRYSSLNYKDGLALGGKARVVRSYPMVPGIDLAGEVVQSEGAEYAPGDAVLATGWGMGETHWGGYTELTRVPGEWLVRLPAGLTLERAMAIGTAGLTAMLAVMDLEARGLEPGGELPAVVTGASGGVGGMAVAILARLGYRVAASTGRAESHDYLRKLGAAEILDRSVFAPADRPLQSARFAGAVDAVGGDTLAALLTMMAQGTSVAVCGNAGGNELRTTVLPMILRGVSLLGIDSNYAPLERRAAAWNRLARDLPDDLTAQMTAVRPLEDLPALGREILQGQIRGRVVIDTTR